MSRYKNMKKLTINQFPLKILAIVFMTLDHIGMFLLSSGMCPDNSPLYYTAYAFRCVGRLALPLFLLFLAEGLHKTHSRSNYLLRLACIWAPITIVLAILNNVAPDLANPQAFTDLLLYALFIYFLEKKGYWKLLAVLPLAYIGLSFAASMTELLSGLDPWSIGTTSWTIYFPHFLRSGYSIYGFLMFLGFYYAPVISKKIISHSSLEAAKDFETYKESFEFQRLINTTGLTLFVIINVVFWAFHYFFPQYDVFLMGTQSYCLIDAIFLYFYSGKRGRDSKAFRYFTYFYYPVHICLLALIFWLI